MNDIERQVARLIQANPRLSKAEAMQGAIECRIVALADKAPETYARFLTLLSDEEQVIIRRIVSGFRQAYMRRMLRPYSVDWSAIEELRLEPATALKYAMEAL